MNRRDFLSVAMAALSLPQDLWRPEPGVSAEEALSPCQPDMSAVLRFGELAILADAVRVQNRSHWDPVRGLVFEHITELRVETATCPKPVFDAFMKTYGGVVRDERPPLEVFPGRFRMLALDNAVVQGVQYTVQSEDMVMAAGLHVVGVWTTLHQVIADFNKRLDASRRGK